jgi:NADH:ubiquinone oxidoreductase subunit E
MQQGENKQVKIARRMALLSAVLALLCGLLLIVDLAVASLRAPAEASLIEELEKLVKTDPEAATTLHEERERQTNASLARKARGRAAAWVLLVAAGVFLASGKWLMSRRPQRLPDLDALVAERFRPTTSTHGKRPAPPAADAPDGEERIDLAFVEDLVARFGGSREAAIPILQAIQMHYRYLPDEVLQRVCELTEITPAQIAGTSSFYAQFRRSPVGRHVVRVCHGTACHVAGADQITQELRRHLEISPDEDTDSRRLFTIDAVACVGCCSLAPVMMIEEETAGRLTPASARQALDALVPPT